jgi:hypothetical protein
MDDPSIFDPSQLPKADRAVYAALRRLESEVGDPARAGDPFQTSRVAIIVESEQKPPSVDCSLYRLDRDGIIRKTGKPGKGTTIEILLRRPA